MTDRILNWTPTLWKPALVVEDRLHDFTCCICGNPGQSTAPNCKTHTGKCREELKRRAHARAMAKLAKRRSNGV